MPQGYYTIEQWRRPRWVGVAVLPFGLSLTAAERELERLGKPGLYRLVQTQRIVWCEREGVGTRLRLRKSHAGSPAGLGRIEQMFDRTGGVYPAEEARAARRAAKRGRRRGSKRGSEGVP
jgi:hypothetical protein